MARNDVPFLLGVPATTRTLTVPAGMSVAGSGLPSAPAICANAIGGATIDTAFSAAYNLAQHQGWRWGKKTGLRREPSFDISLAVFALIGFAIVQTGVDPVALTEYAVIFSAPVLPLTYLPVLLVGRDRQVMGKYANGYLSHGLGWAYFVLICILAVAAPVLFIATNGGG